MADSNLTNSQNISQEAINYVESLFEIAARFSPEIYLQTVDVDPFSDFIDDEDVAIYLQGLVLQVFTSRSAQVANSLDFGIKIGTPDALRSAKLSLRQLNLAHHMVCLYEQFQHAKNLDQEFDKLNDFRCHFRKAYAIWQESMLQRECSEREESTGPVLDTDAFINDSLRDILARRCALRRGMEDAETFLTKLYYFAHQIKKGSNISTAQADTPNLIDILTGEDRLFDKASTHLHRLCYLDEPNPVILIDEKINEVVQELQKILDQRDRISQEIKYLECLLNAWKIIADLTPQSDKADEPTDSNDSVVASNEG